MKLTGPTMSSYPVFPNWVFEGKVELTKEQRTGCLEHATKLDKVETTFGWATKIGNIQDEMFTLSNLTGQMFFNNVVSWSHIEGVMVKRPEGRGKSKAW